MISSSIAASVLFQRLALLGRELMDSFQSTGPIRNPMARCWLGMCLQRTVGHTSAPLPTNLERIKWTSLSPSLVTKIILRIYIVNMKRNFLFMTVSPGILVTLRSNLRFWRKDGVRINIFRGKKKKRFSYRFCPCFYQVMETLAKVWENSGEKVALDSCSQHTSSSPRVPLFFITGWTQML